MKTYGIETTLNLIALSDAFRRHVPFPDQAMAAQLVEKSRQLAVFATYYQGEYPNLPENKATDGCLRKVVTEIAGIAQQMGADTVILPLAGDKRSWISSRVRQCVLKDLDLPVDVTLQKAAYRFNLSALGPIDKDIKTALDEGVRGVMNIDQNLKYTWDR